MVKLTPESLAVTTDLCQGIVAIEKLHGRLLVAKVLAVALNKVVAQYNQMCLGYVATRMTWIHFSDLSNV